jgi:hypothetical protein
VKQEEDSVVGVAIFVYCDAFCSLTTFVQSYLFSFDQMNILLDAFIDEGEVFYANDSTSSAAAGAGSGSRSAAQVCVFSCPWVRYSGFDHFMQVGAKVGIKPPQLSMEELQFIIKVQLCAILRVFGLTY